MAETAGPTVFQLDQPFDSKTFKKVMEDSEYSETSLAKTLGISCAHERQDLEVVYRRVRTDNAYNILVRLFWLGRKVSEASICQKLPTLDINRLVAVGLLRHRDGMIQSNVKLGPYHDLLLASDFGPEIHTELPSDHVLGVGAASVTLANLTVRKKVKTVLDLGCGAGIQAFLTAEHAEDVIGTDTNPRALNFARFNAGLNGIDSIQWCDGSLYRPVAEKYFDLIVSNPPFVISPESRFIFRDAGLPGDSLSEQVLRGAGEHLNEGGFACILFNWYHNSDDSWDARPRSWVSNSGCDAWMLCFKSAEPLVYAADWLGTSVGRSSPDYGKYLDEWTSYYEKMNIDVISAGAIILRRRSGGKNWFRAHSIDKGGSTGPSSDQIERIFAAEDLLQVLDDRQLLQQKLVFDKNHRLEHQLFIEDGRWAVRGGFLHATKGIPFAGNVDMFIVNMLAACDGKRILREIIEEIATQMKHNSQECMTACLSAIRKLMQSGFFSIVEEIGTSG
jgi:methylase of polypeptide subunit release factors